MTPLTPAYIGIGSNQADPPRQLDAALRAIGQLPGTRLVCVSRRYQSRPFGPVAQPDFLNAVAGVLTTLDAPALLAALRGVEEAQGRVRSVRWGPRTLDLDLLVHGQTRLESPELTLPHPGIVERNFVLYPLADIAPDLEIAGVGRVATLAARVDGAGIRVWPESEGS
jgi:2-amino-4-hydroxy-6-hydroxymethyldihydropteridine diphosphokinase